MADDDRAAARVHWLVLAPFTNDPQGRSFAISADSFAETLAKAGLTAEAKVRDCLGGDDTRTFTLRFGELRDFTLKHIVGTDAALKGLLEIADALGKASKPTADEVVQKVEALVGAGRLSQAVRDELEPKPEGEGAKAKLDELVDKGVGRATAKGAVDAFISSMRSSKETAGGLKLSGAKVARRLIEEAVFATASDLLQAESVSRLEGAWRGMKLLMDACPAAAGMHIDVVDVKVEDVADALRDRPELDPFDEPDIVFVAADTTSLDVLGELASMAEERLAPIVIGVGPEILGASAVDGMAQALEDGGDAVDGWNEWRSREEARWISCVANRVALFSEGAGTARRACLASGVWALAAMTARSFAGTGSFAQVTGRDGALKVGGMVELGGRLEGTSVPTEVFVPINPQTALAKHGGLIALGSPRNEDRIVLSYVPTASRAPDAVPLPAQVLTGRIVRFASWVRHQIPAGAAPHEMAEIFKQAAEVFLFPGMEEVARVKADIGEDEQGTKQLGITAKVAASHAGIPFSMAFALPLE